MSTITQNQKRADAAAFHDAMRRLVPALSQMHPARKAASLALLASACQVPCRITLLGETGDDAECRDLLDGLLTRINDETWDLGGGLGEFVCHMTPGEDTHVRS